MTQRWGRIGRRAAALILCGAALPTMSAFADAGTDGAKKPVCLTTYLIDHTEVVDRNTILFYMKGGRVWKNTLVTPCTTLPFGGGFSYAPKADQICDNLEHIRVLRSGQVCLLGAFTPVEKPAGK